MRIFHDPADQGLCFLPRFVPNLQQLCVIIAYFMIPLIVFGGSVRGEPRNPLDGATLDALCRLIAPTHLQGPSPYVIDEQTGHAYEAVSTELRWDQARQLAGGKSLNGVRGHLVTISSEQENAFVHERFCAKPGGIWLGACRGEGASVEWRWITGEPWGTYLNWAPREPNNHQGSNEKYLCMYGSDGASPGQWNDISDYRLPFVIEYDLPADNDAEDPAVYDHPIYENAEAWVFLIPAQSRTKELCERCTAKALALIAKNLMTRALSEVVPATVAKIAGYGFGIITDLPSVGNPTRVDLRILSDSVVSETVAVGDDFLPIIQFNYSDTFNHGLDLHLEHDRDDKRWETVSRIDLLTTEEMAELNERASPGAIFLAVPKQPGTIDTVGAYRMTVTARSTDGRVSRLIHARTKSLDSAQPEARDRTFLVKDEQGHTARVSNLHLSQLQGRSGRRKADHLYLHRGGSMLKVSLHEIERLRRDGSKFEVTFSDGNVVLFDGLGVRFGIRYFLSGYEVIGGRRAPFEVSVNHEYDHPTPQFVEMWRAEPE